MTKALLVAASLCFGVTGSFACEFQRSAKTEAAVDTTVVASVAIPQSQPVAQAEEPTAVDPVVVLPAE